ncbi:hypothetical protein AC578_471 [Pseudocercospora eumusae]|uniref:Uncharacterized protein n=1 Tax=Pseudocercospora eumusae TaxID=321146 RepID=A0A139HY87_9PEZI|nr:hypothetical protein AC578_471 [Pseudocercospora eumusae]
MLNAKALTELLSHNRDERLCRRWYLMTPNGTLLSYSVPTDINDLRKHAAMAAISWQKYQRQHDDDLRVLSIEADTSNIIMRRIQKQLLLVLEAGVPRRRPDFVQKVRAEDSSSSSTHANGGSSNEYEASSVLKLQRQKLDKLAEAILGEFERTAFQMPEDAGSTVF